MFQPAEREIKKVKTASNANTAIIAQMSEEIATLKNQVSELKGQLKTAMEMIKEMKEKQERQEREDEYVLFDDGLPLEFYEELHERNMN